MKYIILTVLMVSSSFAENKIIDYISIKDSIGFSPRTINFKVLCIDGYQYLLTEGSSSAIVQMFYRPKNTRDSVPVKCNGFEETRN